MTKTPKLTVGLPIYNGETYLEASLRSILGQSYGDLELIIADNASTDRTEEICRDFMTDPRIRYERNRKNLGAACSHNQVIQLARGEFFKLASDDDLYGPIYLESCLEALQADPDAVLYHSRTVLIDEAGHELGRLKAAGSVRTNSRRPYQRFTDIVGSVQDYWPLFGVIRTEALRATTGFQGFPLSDLVLQAELSLLGSFGEVPEFFFYRRIHPDMSSALLTQDPQLYAEWWDPANTVGKSHFKWRRLQGYVASAWNGPVGPLEKGLCLLGIARRYGYNAARKVWARLSGSRSTNQHADLWGVYTDVS